MHRLINCGEAFSECATDTQQEHQILMLSNVAGWKKDSRNTYVNAREECEGNLKVLIVRMKAEIVEAAEGEKA